MTLLKITKTTLLVLLKLIIECFTREHRQLFLWVPVCLGIGIALYFSLSFEPTWYVPALITSNFFLLWLSLKKKYIVLSLLSLAGCLIALGTTLSCIRSHSVMSPLIPKMAMYDVKGIIADIDTNYKGIQRYILNVTSIDSLTADQTPKRIRATIRTETHDAKIGDTVSFTAKLSAPPKPVMPGAYDFSRKSFFNRIGAVGFSISDITIIDSSSHPEATLYQPVLKLRESISEYNHEILGQKTGSIASALMVGKRYGIDDETITHIRNAGIAHLLAISGLHLVIVTGFSFWMVRFLLCYSKRMTEYYDIKKIAASCAILAGGFYLLMTGMPVSALRAYVMTTLVLTAILIDREPTPMNSVALAALCILVMKPESLLTPGFQMSFAAVIALIASYNILYQNRPPRTNTHIIHRFSSYVGNIMISSLVAAIATTPFGMYHFNNYSLYGVITNLIAIPLTTLWIMPLAVCSILLYPLKLSFLTLIPMGYGIDIILVLSKHIASFPYAYRIIPSFSPAILSIFIFSSLWLCLWRTKIRFMATPFILTGLLLIYTQSHQQIPDVIISGDANKGYAIVTKEGTLQFSDKGRSNYERDTWVRRMGINDPDLNKLIASNQYQCDLFSCTYSTKGVTVAFSKDPFALAEDCDAADIVVNLTFTSAYRAYPSECANTKIISRYHLWKEGSHTIKINKGGNTEVQTVREHSKSRPWG